MIKTIIKLDNTEQEFTPGKLNRWGEWAAETLGDKVDWSGVVMDAVQHLPERVTSQDLQMKLIDECLSRDTWSYYLMAGRLYAVWLRKKLYGIDGIPTVKALQTRMRKDGIMVKLNYSTQEYEQIEKFINHELDLQTPHFALHHIRSKYALQNRVTKKEYETPQFVYMRMAMALSEKEPKAERLEHVKNYYELFSRKQLSAPTPNYVNLGTVLRGFASCCLIATGDTGESLAVGDFIANMMTQKSAGIGMNMMCRSIGDPVRNGLIIHNGKKPYIDALGKAVRANIQAGRGGAITFYYNAFDPEGEMISQLRNPRSTEDKKNRDLHYALIQNHLFNAKAAQKDGQVFLFNVYTAPDLHEAFYGKDQEKFKELYEKYEADPNFKKVYINARDLLKVALNEGFETGTAYMANATEINRHTSFKEPIHSSNLCVAPETQILTDKGYVQIQSVAGTKQNVWNGQEWSEVDVVKTGENQKLITVITDSGPILECTPYHKFYVVDDYGMAPREVRAHELKSGDKLIKCEMPVVEGTMELDRAYINGFYSGDGCKVREGNRIYLYGEKMKLADQFGDVRWSHHVDSNRLTATLRDLEEKFFVPDAKYSVSSRLKWFAGYADADGCIYRNGDNQQLVVSSINYKFLHQMQLMLNTIGVTAKIHQVTEKGYYSLPLNNGTGEYGQFFCQDVWRLIVTSVDLQKLLDLGIEFKRLSVIKHTPQRNARQFTKIVTVLDFDRTDDTYCFTEPKRHMGVFNGLLTGQCLEITQPTSPYYHMIDLYSTEDHGRGEISTCSLAAIPVDNIPDTATYQKACYYALKMIDYCIHNAEYAFPHLEFTAKQRMNAGVGIMGLATHLARAGLKYSDEAGKREINFVAERHMYHMIEASLRLAKERGNAPWIHKTRWPEGWLPIDTYNRNVDTIVEGGFDSYFNWEKLRARVIEQGGIGHSSLVAYMPGEASSKALGGANSIYPIRRKTLGKSDLNNKIKWAAPYSDDPNYVYELAYDIKIKDQIDMYAIVQKHTDQAISGDWWRRIVGAEKITSNEMLSSHFYMIKMGVKTRYYINTETTANLSLEALETAFENNDGTRGCAGGACSL